MMIEKLKDEYKEWKKYIYMMPIRELKYFIDVHLCEKHEQKESLSNDIIKFVLCRMNRNSKYKKKKKRKIGRKNT